MIKQKSVLVLGLILGQLWVSSALADSAIVRMERFFKNVTSMSAEFTQSIISETRSSEEESRGILLMQRPGKFRWNYQKPYQQQIVADGKRLWIYDVEMEQVIVKPEDLALGNTPAILLSGDVSITDKFIVTEIAGDSSQHKNLFWVQLLPKEQDTGFEKLLLAFAGDQLKYMELKDTFGQTTRLEFSNLKLNKSIDASTFRFDVPDGVDVIDETKAKQ